MQHKTDNLSAQLLGLLSPNLFLNPNHHQDFLKFIKQGELTRKENPEYHSCVSFIPFNQQAQQILIVHHKKAKQWVVPGGHLEKGETLEDAVMREANEELGIKIEKVSKPFLFSIMQIQNAVQSCKTHHDIWYLIPVTQKLNIDYSEFNDIQWVKIPEAKKIITHQTYLQALGRITNN